MPIKPVKLELGVFTKEDEERMWEQLREVWRKEKEDDKLSLSQE